MAWSDGGWRWSWDVVDLPRALRRQRGKLLREIQGASLERKEEDACREGQ